MALKAVREKNNVLTRGPKKAAALRAEQATQRDLKAFADWQHKNRSVLSERGKPLDADMRLKKFIRSTTPQHRRIIRLRQALTAGNLPVLKK